MRSSRRPRFARPRLNAGVGHHDMDNLVRDDTPHMGVLAHFVCTMLGLAFGAGACYLGYLTFQDFSWGRLAVTLSALFLAEEFFRGAVTRRYPGWVLVFLLTP